MKRENYLGKTIRTIALNVMLGIILLVMLGNNVYAADTDISLGNEKLPSRFSLQDIISKNVVVKDQQATGSCWAFSTLSSLETNLAMKDYKEGKANSKVYDFSERHMEYATSREFLNAAQNANGLNRNVGDGGCWEYALSYLTNGTGAIAEKDMPFENNEDKIEISKIQNKTVTSRVYDTIDFGNYNSERRMIDFYQEKVDNGETSEYMNYEEKIAEIKNNINTEIDKIKTHIKNYGSVTACMSTGLNILSGGFPSYKYNKETHAYYSEGSGTFVNHLVSIIGWDDNFSKDNFVEGNRPKTNGAWIVRNSWGEAEGDKGLVYVSYEDGDISKTLHGIIRASDTVDYEKIYQYNKYISNYSYYTTGFKSGASLKTAMLCDVFEKGNDTEYITSVSLELSPYYKETGTFTCRVFVNPNGDDKSIEKLQEVKIKSQSTNLQSGYHTLEFSRPVKISGNKFVVAVEMASNEGIYITVEKKDEKTNDNVGGPKGKEFVGVYKTDYSTNKEIFDKWIDINSLEDMVGNTTLKAFTVSENNPIIKNLKVIKGDINGDEKVSATDLLKLKRKIVGIESITSDDIEAGDMNEDGKITATDLLKLKRKIVGLN